MFEEEDVNSAKLNLLAAVFTVALFGTSAVAQEGPRGGFGGAARELRGLDLSDAQKAQVKQIMAAERPTLKPLVQQEMQSRQQMTALVRGGSFEEAKAQPIAAQEAQVHSQIAVERAKIEAQIYQLLTPQQKSKLAEREARRGRWARQQAPAEETPEAPKQ
jgi:periplasmic protein CpxP/Spy